MCRVSRNFRGTPPLWSTAAAKGLRNIAFIAADLSDFDEATEPESFDPITTFGAVHDQAQPPCGLTGIHRALKADGVFLMQDIAGSSQVRNNLAHPLGTFLTVSGMRCMTVSRAQGDKGLGAMRGEEKTREYLQRGSFRSEVNAIGVSRWIHGRGHSACGTGLCGARALRG
jgi:hypothetical protein